MALRPGLIPWAYPKAMPYIKRAAATDDRVRGVHSHEQSENRIRFHESATSSPRPLRLFKEKGCRVTTLEDIAAVVGMCKGSL